MKKVKQSEIISTFLKLVDAIQKEYETAYGFVSEKDKELTDITHKAELTKLKQNEKAKLMTELQYNRRERRYWKNKVDEFQPLYELMSNSKEFKSAIAQLKQVLGKVRKAEEYLENRTYKPRAKKNQ
ncbi:MAG: hypothetical protein J6J36_02925 [Clostridia bacterium]|nr:hypothetical protein [Clostridia bacterium]